MRAINPRGANGKTLEPSSNQFDKYTLLAKLATGGMAEIFVARLRGAAGFRKQVVIKRILPHVAHNKDFIRMFLDEAITTARITHPNVCQVFELCQVEDTHFLVLEYLEGVPVSDLLRRCQASKKHLDMRLAAGIVVQAADGLHAAHEQRDDNGELARLVHRDVSPGNLFVTVDGIVKVLDFGIAKARWMSRITRNGTLLGKCEYMSPEQARGGTPLDRRSDVFSLGIIFYELLVGRRLFRRENDYETLRAVLRYPIEKPSQIRSAIPQDLEDVVMRALSRDREERYDSAYEFRQAVTTALKPLGGTMPVSDLGPLIKKSFAQELASQRQAISRALKRNPTEVGLDTAETSVPRTPTVARPHRWPRSRSVAKEKRSSIPGISRLPSKPSHAQGEPRRPQTWSSAVAAGAPARCVLSIPRPPRRTTALPELPIDLQLPPHTPNPHRAATAAPTQTFVRQPPSATPRSVAAPSRSRFWPYVSGAVAVASMLCIVYLGRDSGYPDARPKSESGTIATQTLAPRHANAQQPVSILGTSGTLTVRSSVLAAIYTYSGPGAVGKRFLGETPLRDIELPPGTYKMKAVDKSGTAKHFHVTIEDGKATEKYLGTWDAL